MQAECIQHVLVDRQLTDLTPADLFEEMDLDCDEKATALEGCLFCEQYRFNSPM